MNSIVCNCRAGDRQCGGELLPAVMGQALLLGQQSAYRVVCGFCGNASLVTVRWETRPMIVEARAVPERMEGG